MYLVHLAFLIDSCFMFGVLLIAWLFNYMHKHYFFYPNISDMVGQVTAVELENVLAKGAYMLLYSR